MSTNVLAHVHIPTSLTIRLCVVFHALGRAGFRWSQTTTSGDAHNAPSGGNRAVCVPTQKCGCALVYIYSDRGLYFYAVHVYLPKSVGRRYRAQRINVNIVVLSSGNTWPKGLWTESFYFDFKWLALQTILCDYNRWPILVLLKVEIPYLERKPKYSTYKSGYVSLP